MPSAVIWCYIENKIDYIMIGETLEWIPQPMPSGCEMTIQSPQE